MTTGAGDEVDLQAEVERLRAQLAAANRRAAGALASQQQLGLAMEKIRQQNAELDRLATDLEAARQAEAQRAEELATSNARLHDLVEQLSTPILRVGDDMLALPLVGSIDDVRAATITEKALAEVVDRRARRIVLDLTGMTSVDPRTLDHVVRFVGAARLLGARCVLCGLRPEVAGALCGLEGWQTIEAVRDLSEALRR